MTINDSPTHELFDINHMRFVYLLILEADLELEEYLSSKIKSLVSKIQTMSFVSGLELINTIITNLQIGRSGFEDSLLSRFQVELNAIQQSTNSPLTHMKALSLRNRVILFQESFFSEVLNLYIWSVKKIRQDIGLPQKTKSTSQYKQQIMDIHLIMILKETFLKL